MTDQSNGAEDPSLDSGRVAGKNEGRPRNFREALAQGYTKEEEIDGPFELKHKSMTAGKFATNPTPKMTMENALIRHHELVVVCEVHMEAHMELANGLRQSGKTLRSRVAASVTLGAFLAVFSYFIENIWFALFALVWSIGAAIVSGTSKPYDYLSEEQEHFAAMHAWNDISQDLIEIPSMKTDIEIDNAVSRLERKGKRIMKSLAGARVSPDRIRELEAAEMKRRGIRPK